MQMGCQLVSIVIFIMDNRELVKWDMKCMMRIRTKMGILF